MKLFGWDTDRLSLETFGFGSPRNTERDWRILLVVALVLLIVFVSFSAWTFLRVEAGNLASVDTSDLSNNQSVTLDREQLNQAVADFQKERATFDLLRDRQPNIPNPSR
jgi:uncharacterized protein YpmS